MKSSEEFDDFYKRELKDPIDHLESIRKAITEKYSFNIYKRNIKWMAILCVMVLIGRSTFPNELPEYVIWIIPLCIGYLIVAAIYILIMRTKHFNPVQLAYKQTVIPKLIAFVDSNLNYLPQEGITAAEFDSGNLFGRHTSYRSEDLVHGKNGELEIKMADIDCSRRTKSSGKNSSSSSVTVFKGFYVICKLSKNIPVGVIIKPAIPGSDALVGLARKYLGDKMVDNLSHKLGLNDITTGNEEFDKMYLVQSTRPEEAKALLTPRFIQIIQTFQKELGLPVSFSFFNNSVHIAFDGINLFEASVFTSFVEKDISKQYFNYLNLAYGIIEAIQGSRNDQQ